MKKEEEIKQRYERLAGELNERTRRLFAANEAMALGWGGAASGRGTDPKDRRRAQEQREQGSQPERRPGTTGGASDAGRPGVATAVDEQERAQAGQGTAAPGTSGVA